MSFTRIGKNILLNINVILQSYIDILKSMNDLVTNSNPIRVYSYKNGNMIIALSSFDINDTEHFINFGLSSELVFMLAKAAIDGCDYLKIDETGPSNTMTINGLHISAGHLPHYDMIRLNNIIENKTSNSVTVFFHGFGWIVDISHPEYEIELRNHNLSNDLMNLLTEAKNNNIEIIDFDSDAEYDCNWPIFNYSDHIQHQNHDLPEGF